MPTIKIAFFANLNGESDDYSHTNVGDGGCEEEEEDDVKFSKRNQFILQQYDQQTLKRTIR